MSVKMKSLMVSSVVILAICWVQYSLAQSHNSIWGTINTGDRLLYKDTIRKPFSHLQKVTRDIVYVGYPRITGIRITDEYHNGNGGYATLSKGGIGSNNVTIHLKSQRGHGFNFRVEIYAHQHSNFSWGTPDRLHKLLFKDTISRKSEVSERVDTDFVFFGNKTISHIKATDVGGSGGNITIKDGGLGRNNVTMYFVSQVGQGFSFILEIFGK